MTVVTTRPNATTSNTGTVTGLGGDADAVLADSSDSTYVALAAGQAILVTNADPTIPAGGVVRAVQLRLRAKASSSAGVSMGVRDGSLEIVSTGTGTIFWPTAVTWTPLSASALGQSPSGITAALNADSGGTVTLYAIYIDTVYVAKPTLTVNAPTGTITATNRPTASWTGTFDSDGSTQISYRVKVFNSTQYGAGGFDPETSTPVWDSGETVSTDTSVVVGTNLPNATYRAYVQLGALVDFSTGIKSDWTYGGFVQNVTPPPAPTQTVTLHNSGGYIEVDVVYGGGTITSGLEVDRQNPDGNWTQITSGTGGTIADYYDYLAYGGTVNYRARAYRDVSGDYIYSDYDTDAVVYQPNWWLKHPETSSLNKELNLKSFNVVEKPARQGTFQALGATKAVTISDSRGAEQGVMEVWCDTDADRDAIYDLIETGDSLFLQAKYDEHENDRWVSIGDVSAERAIPMGSKAKRSLSLPWVEVESPE